MLRFMKKTSTRKTLIIHIGYHKTATTTLQRFLTDNVKVLAKHGVLYPKSGRADGETHGLLANLLKPENNRESDGLECWKKLDNELAQFQGHTAILSSECFLESRKIPPVIARLSSNYNVKIVVYLRRQDHWIQSVYNEVVADSMRRHVGSIKDLREYRDGWLEYDKILALWQESFGPGSLVVRPFEKGQFRGNDVRLDFLHALGLDFQPELKLNGSRSQSNPSMPPELVEFLRRCNLIAMTYPQHQELVGAMREVGLHWNGAQLPTNAWISGADKQDLVKQFDDCNRRLGRDYGANATNLFQEAWPQASGSALGDELLGPELQHEIFDKLPASVQRMLAAQSPVIKKRTRPEAFLRKPPVANAPRLRGIIMRQRNELRMLYRQLGIMD
jgi:hypothetical protein